MGLGLARLFTAYLLSAAALIVFVWIQHRMGDDAAAASDVPQPHLLGRLRPGHHHRHGHVRRPVGHPLYLQIVKGASPTLSGLLLLPPVGGLMLASLGTGQVIARTGRYKVFPVVGSVLWPRL